MSTIKKIQTSYATSLDPLDREIIIAHILKKTREFVLAHPEHDLTKEQALQIEAFFTRRLQGEPVAYITGHKEFYGHDFIVNKNVLIPRPDTEQMIDIVLKKIEQPLKQKVKTGFFDVGTGSGCIIISLAKKLLRSSSRSTLPTCIGIDISEKALEIARINSKKQTLSKNVLFIRSDLLSNIPLRETIQELGSIYFIANLPYVPTDYLKQRSTSDTLGLRFEPSCALDGGTDGLDHYRKLTQQIKDLHEAFPKISLHALYEIGPHQTVALQGIVHEAFQHISIALYKDLAGRPRIVAFDIDPSL